MFEFMLGKKPKDQLSMLDDKIAKWNGEQASRDGRRQALMARLDDIKLDVSTGDPEANREFSEIHATLNGLTLKDEAAAEARIDLDASIVKAKAEIAAEKEAAERAARIRSAKAELKRIPTMFNEMKELDVRRAALHRELASIEPAAKHSVDLDTWQADVTAWLEWRAGMRELNPTEQAAHDRRQEHQEAYRRHKAEMAWQNSPEKAARDTERYARAGWQVHDGRAPKYDSEKREWV